MYVYVYNIKPRIKIPHVMSILSLVLGWGLFIDAENNSVITGHIYFKLRVGPNYRNRDPNNRSR